MPHYGRKGNSAKMPDQFQETLGEEEAEPFLVFIFTDLCRRPDKITIRETAAVARYLEWLEAYLVRERVTDPALWKALRQALRPYRHPWLYRVGRQAARCESMGRRLRARWS